MNTKKPTNNETIPNLEIGKAGTIDEMPLEVLPQVIQDVCDALAQYSNIAQWIFFHLALAFVGAAIGAAAWAEGKRNKRRYWPAISATLGCPSGLGKSFLFYHLGRPFDKKKATDSDNWTLAGRADHKAAIEELKKEIADLKSAGDEKSLGFAKILGRELEAMEKVKRPQCYVVNTPTTAAVRKYIIRNRKWAAAYNPEQYPRSNGIAVINGECTDFFKTLTPSASNFNPGTNGNALLLDLYSATMADRETAGDDDDDTSLGEHPLGAMIFAAVSEQFLETYGEPKLIQNGFLARTLPVEYPGLIPKFNDAHPVNPAGLEPFYALLETLFELREAAEATVIEMSESACAELTQYANECTDRANGELNDISGIPQRWAENAGRMSVIFHLCYHGKAAAKHVLTLETVQKAIITMRFLAGQQLRIYARGRLEKLSGDTAVIIEALAKESVKIKTDKKDRPFTGATAHELRNGNACRQRFASSEKIETALWTQVDLGTLLFWHRFAGKKSQSRFWIKDKTGIKLHKEYCAAWGKSDPQPTIIFPTKAEKTGQETPADDTKTTAPAAEEQKVTAKSPGQIRYEKAQIADPRTHEYPWPELADAVQKEWEEGANAEVQGTTTGRDSAQQAADSAPVGPIGKSLFDTLYATSAEFREASDELTESGLF